MEDEVAILPINLRQKLILDKLVVEKIVGFETILLDFSSDHQKSVYIIKCDGVSPADRSVVTTAIRLICCSSYATCQPSDLGAFANAKVTVAFYNPLPMDAALAQQRAINMEEDPDVIAINPAPQSPPSAYIVDSSDSDDDAPCTSQQAIARELRRQTRKQHRLQQYAAIRAANMPDHERIVAWRDMGGDSSCINYTINDGPLRMCSVAMFQRRFKLNVNDVFPCADGRGDDEATKKGNWLHFISTRLNDYWNEKADLNNLFERFVHLYIKDEGCSKEQILSTLTTQCLCGQIALDVLQKTELLQIFKETRRVFEFICNSEYTVFFIVPLNDRFEQIENLAVAELNFEQIETYIHQNRDGVNVRFSWENIKQTYRDILVISFQLVLAFRCQQKIIYLQNMDKIQEYETLDYLNVALLRATGIPSSHWLRTNYLQRIVHVCVQFNVCAFIEYPGRLAMRPVYSYLMSFYKDSDDKLSVHFYDDQAEESLQESLQNVFTNFA